MLLVELILYNLTIFFRSRSLIGEMSLYEFICQFRSYIDSIDCNCKRSIFACKFSVCGIISGESNFNSNFVAGLVPNQLCLKIIDKSIGTDCQIITCSASTFKFFTINCTNIINIYLVAIGNFQRSVITDFLIGT